MRSNESYNLTSFSFTSELCESRAIGRTGCSLPVLDLRLLATAAYYRAERNSPITCLQARSVPLRNSVVNWVGKGERARPTAYQVSCPWRVYGSLALLMFPSHSWVLVLITALCREQTQAVGEPQSGMSLKYICSGVLRI